MKQVTILLLSIVVALSFQAVSADTKVPPNTLEQGSWLGVLNSSVIYNGATSLYNGAAAVAQGAKDQIAEKARYVATRNDPGLQKKMVGITEDQAENEKTQEVYNAAQENYAGCDIKALSKRMAIAAIEAHKLSNTKADSVEGFIAHLKTVERFLKLNRMILPKFIVDSLETNVSEQREKFKEEIAKLAN